MDGLNFLLVKNIGKDFSNRKILITKATLLGITGR